MAGHGLPISEAHVQGGQWPGMAFDTWHHMRGFVQICRRQSSYQLKLTSLLSGQHRVQGDLYVAHFGNILGQLRQLLFAGACKITRRESKSGKPGIE